jgi:hypothetical protein
MIKATLKCERAKWISEAVLNTLSVAGIIDARSRIRD